MRISQFYKTADDIRKSLVRDYGFAFKQKQECVKNRDWDMYSHYLGNLCILASQLHSFFDYDFGVLLKCMSNN